MAFEDRCSPNEANSPGPITGRVPAPHAENFMNFCSQNQYTCTTIEQRFDRIQSPNMTIVKVQPNSPPPSPDRENPVYHNYYEAERPDTPELKPIVSPEGCEAPKQKNQRPQPTVSINFSINNILHPEFGLTAIRKTSKIEGPKPVGPNHSILYKPYDLSKPVSSSGLNFQKTFSFDYLKSKHDDATNLPPLGGLKQTVSQIGEIKEKDIPKITPEQSQKRPDSASSIVSSTSSGTPSTCGSVDTATQSQSGNATLWPAWVYCTRYSDRPSSGICQ